jgi:quercetin dioxygenase-like cupin family protein
MSDPYSIMRAGDAPDFAQGKASPFLGYGRPMGSEQLALNMRVLAPGAAHVPPGGDPTKGHSHVNIEEIYFVLDGELTMKVGDDVHTLGPRDAILMAPGTPRASRNDTDSETAFAMISVKVSDHSTETKSHEDFWPTG